jgi:hypothetical protein
LVADLIDDSDGLAREALLDMSADRALGMVRAWPQLMQSAAELWAALPSDPTVSDSGDPIAILAAMGRAVDTSNIASTLVHGDASPWVSDLRFWRSTPWGA